MLNLPIEIGLPLISECLQKEKDNHLYLEWLVQLPIQNYWIGVGAMKKSDQMTFEEYKEKRTGKNIVMKSTKDILKEAKEIEKEFANGD